MPPAVRVTAKARPFQTARVERSMPAGLTVSEILEEMHLPAGLPTDTVVILGDQKLPPSVWSRTRPKAGTQLIVNVMPHDPGGGGGGSDARIVVLQLAILAAAVAVPHLAFFGTFAGGAFAAGTLGGALVSVGIGATGPLVVTRPPR
jgi:hypothetical protein